jgi:signal transduction histidine kinase
LIGKVEKEVLKNGEETWALTSKMPLRNKAGQIIGTFGISKDITDIKVAEAKLEQVHRQLLETSRMAGMAEIASNVLHNVGNVLNSVNVSASLVAGSVKQSKVANLAKIVVMLQEHEHDLGTFLTSDPKGKQLPVYLAQLSEHLVAEQKAAAEELGQLCGNIEHIKEIVAMQQTYAKVSGVKEIINLNELVEASLHINEAALGRHHVEVIREFEKVPPVNVEKHKILQILVNLIRNAKHACQDSERRDSRLTVKVINSEDWIKISVNDNGVGILSENMTRIFNHGFTTRKDGHGFGLHSGALAAKELGGYLTAQSEGPGQGATFTLALPCTETVNGK